MLENIQNYGKYVPLITHGTILIDCSEINYKSWDEHFTSIYNIMRDGIETEQVQNMIIQVDFHNIVVDFYIFDYWFNLIMWKLKCAIGEEIRPKDIFFEDFIRAKYIKKYIDNKFLEDNTTKYNNIILNNIIDDCLYEFSKIDTFAMYLGNTIDCDSFIKLWYQYPETQQLMSVKMATEDNLVPIEQTMSLGTEATNKLLNYINNSDHCLSDFVKAGQGLNAKQFKEFATHIGPKPDGNGGIYPIILDTNFLMGGVKTVPAYLIESAVGRVAQTIVKTNVGDAGYFANILKLNNIDSNIYTVPDYDCGTKNFQIVEFKTEDIVRRFVKCWFRFKENGPEYLIKDDMVPSLVGQTVYVRTPMTCASHAAGRGICYKCYGTLAYTNEDINVGEIASEVLSAQLTQKMLSAKHLLESAIVELEWSHGFKDYFQIDYNTIKIQDNIETKKMKLKINPDNITLESEEDYANDNEYNEYITSFTLVLANGQEIPVFTSANDKLYITRPLNDIIRKTAENEEGLISIDVSKLEDYPLFMVVIHNNELTKGLELIKGLINRNDSINNPHMNRHLWLQMLVETCIECSMDINAIHLALILSNQLRSVNDELEKPEWQYPNEPYQLMTLNQALTKNPSITVSLLYQKIGKMLYNPLSFRKHKASYLDLFFMKKPQNIISGLVDIVETTITDEGLKNGITFDE